MREFPTYERALMTNARCLTEGVDIPAIDCVVFADRKNSTVDIVQAAGRAMRTAPAKDKGHILIPLVVDDDVDAEGIETFAKTSGFREIACIVAALSTNDERIVEQFRVIYDGDKIPSGGGIIKFDGSLAGACGNGTRCVADRLARETGASGFAIETERGIIRCERLGERCVGIRQLAFPVQLRLARY